MPELTIFKSISKEKLERKVEDYFNSCKKKHVPPSMTGLALHLKCTRKNIVDYKHTDEYGAILEQAKLRCENVLEERMINGTPPTGIIFILKNNYGWHDKIESDVNLTGNISLSKLFQQAEEKRLAEGTREDVIDGEVEELPLEENLFDEVGNEENHFEDEILINEETDQLPDRLF